MASFPLLSVALLTLALIAAPACIEAAAQPQTGQKLTAPVLQPPKPLPAANAKEARPPQDLTRRVGNCGDQAAIAAGQQEARQKSDDQMTAASNDLGLGLVSGAVQLGAAVVTPNLAPAPQSSAKAAPARAPAPDPCAERGN